MGHPERGELLTEYYKLIDLIYRYDDYFIRIKTGSISLGTIATGISLGIQSIYPIVLVIILALAFWLTEASLKVVQLSNFKRVTELEDTLDSRSYENSDFPAPRIIQGYSENRKANEASWLWWKVMWWKHVMFPHVLFLIGGLVGMIVSLISLIT
ncbi:MAG: hypothetical protein AAF327_17510 [Cyanobacteria bacterium P01_A01_bin.37]